MNTRFTLRIAALGTVLLASSATSVGLAQRAPRRPAATSHTCVQFHREPSADGRSVEFQLANHCAVSVEGQVSWRLACGDDDASDAQERRQGLLPGETRAITATVEACGNRAFSINDVRWSWRPLGQP